MASSHNLRSSISPAFYTTFAVFSPLQDTTVRKALICDRQHTLSGGELWGGCTQKLVNEKPGNEKVFTDFRYYNIKVLKSSPLTKSSTTVVREIDFSVEQPIQCWKQLTLHPRFEIFATALQSSILHSVRLQVTNFFLDALCCPNHTLL